MTPAEESCRLSIQSEDELLGLQKTKIPEQKKTWPLNKRCRLEMLVMGGSTIT